jgi:hypothetical protein
MTIEFELDNTGCQTFDYETSVYIQQDRSATLVR